MMDATPALVDVEDVEQGALDGDQPGAQCLRLRAARRLLHISRAPPAQLVMRYPPLLFCFVL